MVNDGEVNYNLVGSNVKSKIKQEVLKKCVKMSFNNKKGTTITDEPLQLLNEIIQKLVIEAALRGAKQAVYDHQIRIEMEQIEKILPQLLLDFP